MADNQHDIFLGPAADPKLVGAITELKRELSMRKHVYPRSIERGKLTREQAAQRIIRVEHAIEFLEKLA